ncbi:PBP1A family penicillin-binding protein [bacterium]|nr:PBP1A family penicillin-binding protein [bacterium]
MMNYPRMMKNLRWNRILFIFCSFGVVMGIAIGISIGWIAKELPPVDVLTHYKPAIQTIVLDTDGKRIGKYYDERRLVLKREQIPQYVIETLLAAEDQEFYRHTGFDIPGILRAFWANLKSFSISQGGSTISQQVARLMFLTTERTFTRKIKEAILTVQIEKKFSKDEIITIYLNQNCFGHGAFGIEAAARSFFQKTTAELSIPESALLMSLLKNPTRFSPIKHPDKSIGSRNRVLARMVDSAFITEEEEKRYSSEQLNLNIDIQQGFIAPYFVEEIRQTLTRVLGSKQVTTGGLTVRSTLNRGHQEAANRAVQEGIKAFQERHSKAEDIQAALIAIRPGTGEITAMVGGSSFRKTKFNRSIQSKRQSGSAIKPFVYLAALQKGFTPSTILMDTPYEYIDPQTGKSWKPGNYDRKFRGPVTLRNCLEDSLNIPTVKLVDKIGLDMFLRTVSAAGIKSGLPPFRSSVLGTGEVTLLELTNAYATIASGGMRVEPRMITSVKNSEGKSIFKQERKIEEVFDAQSCYQLTEILEGAVKYGTCWRAKVLGIPVAAKTGTTDNYTNAWFIGYVNDLAVGVWVGFDLNVSMGHGETGSRAAGPIFVDFMRDVLMGQQIQQFDVPDGIINIPICHESGYIAGRNCPVVIKEPFKENQTPHLKCPIHPEY